MDLIKRHWIPISIFGAICIIFALVMSQNINWETWRGISCVPERCFCEAIRMDETIRQPSNAWSSMAFALVGLLIAGHALREIGSDNRLSLIFALILSFALIAIGVGSAFYHASLVFWGQFVDVGSMYLLASFMLVYAWVRLFRLPTVASTLLYFGINVVLFILLYYIPSTRRSVFGGILMLGIAFELYYAAFRKPELKRHWFNYGLLLFAVAFFIWNLDNNGTLCAANSLIQGHAIWHILGAVSSGMLYLYYFSEPVGKLNSHANE